MFIFSFVSLLSYAVAKPSEASYHFQQCQSGYNHKSTCYRIGEESSFFSKGTCDRVVIESEEENNYIREMLSDLGLPSVWIGRAYRPKYTNFFDRHRVCNSMGEDGMWYGHTYIECRDMRKQTVCTYRLACRKGWIGENCDKQCNCYDETCSRFQDVCKYGCRKGWTGKGCFDEMAAPKVEYYCFKYENRYALSLSMVLKSKKIGSVVPLGVDGYPINPEEYTKEYTKDGFLEISSQDLTSPFEPDFHERMIDGTTFEWDLRIRQSQDVRMQADIDMRMRCNFSDVDEMFASTSINLDSGSLGTYSLSIPSFSYTTAGMFFSEPRSTDFLTNIDIGQPVRVILLQQFVDFNNVSAEEMKPNPYLSPRKCFATSPDKKIVKQLSDANGCPLEIDLFAMFVLKQDKKLITSVFPAFGLPGHSSMNISCSLVTCTSYEDYSCVQPCRYPLNSRYARSTAEIRDEVIQDVSARINIR